MLQATARIAFGETSTYAEVAGQAGSPRAVRAAGNALGANPIPVVVPCHRVLRTGGALGGYTGGSSARSSCCASRASCLTGAAAAATIGPPGEVAEWLKALAC